MLGTITKSITLSGESIITVDGKDMVAQRYTATVNTTNPEDINMSSFQVNKSVYKDNRTQCHADLADFEDAAYAIQEEMLTENEEDTAE